jgi:ABC-type antimicrobial peptide transport system permease subunit
MIPYLSGLGLLADRLLRLSTHVIVLSMIVAALIGIVSSLIPAVAALRRNIVEGLRTVG